jgi:peroxiredoxin Q/BCP
MISVDTPETNKKFAEQEQADFPMLSDPTKATATAYGVLNQAGMANRWTFYIGPDGRIQAIDKQVRVATAGEDLVARLKELGVKQR